MTDPIRLLHFSDVHIGVENYGGVDPTTGISSRVMDFLRSLNALVEYAEQNEADLVIFSGDAFKSSTPNPTYQREFARRIKRLAKLCPVVLLAGNHDIPAMTQKASSVEIFHTLAVDNVIVGRADELHRIETRRGPVQVATVPYPLRQRLLADVSTAGMNLGDLDVLLGEQVGQLFRSLASQVDPAIPAVLTAHLTVQGAKYGSERGIMLGRDVSVLLSTVSDPAWDYVALGHIHYHQDVNLGHHPPIVYAGSLERIDFGEEADPKGFVWVNLLRGETTYQFVELNARPFITIRVDVRDRRNPTEVVLKEIARHDVTDAVVRVIITATPENEPLIRKKEIEAALEGAGFIAAIQHDIEYPVRARLGVERPEELAPLDLLQLYLSQKGTPPDRIELLKQYAERLMDEDSTTSLQP